MAEYKRIKELRKDKGLKQKEISTILNIHTNTSANYERGTREITLDVLISMAKYYNVSIDYIAGITQNKRGLNNLNEEENSLLEQYNELTERNKGKVEWALEESLRKQRVQYEMDKRRKNDNR